MVKGQLYHCHFDWSVAKRRNPICLSHPECNEGSHVAKHHYLSFRLERSETEKSPKAKHCSTKYYAFLIEGFFDSVPIALRSEWHFLTTCHPECNEGSPKAKHLCVISTEACNACVAERSLTIIHTVGMSPLRSTWHYIAKHHSLSFRLHAVRERPQGAGVEKSLVIDRNC